MSRVGAPAVLSAEQQLQILQLAAAQQTAPATSDAVRAASGGGPRDGETFSVEV